MDLIIGGSCLWSGKNPKLLAMGWSEQKEGNGGRKQNFHLLVFEAHHQMIVKK
jgi:hypothetical protein